MADVTSAQVAMNASTATLITRGDADGCVLRLHNRTGTIVYIGGSDVTSSTGMGIDSAAGPVELRLPPGADIWGITASGTPSIQMLRIG